MDHPTDDYDLAIVGLGSAGEAVASQAAEAGFRVIGFEDRLVGGECPFFACMPSKAMLYDAANSERTWDAAVARRDDIVDHRNDAAHARRLQDAGVVLVREQARLVGERRIRAGRGEVTADRVVLATGADPIMPRIDGIDRDRVWTSDVALSVTDRPESLLIVGGGPIGCELGEVFRHYGTRVTLIERNDTLDDTVEPEIATLLEAHLVGLGVELHLGTDIARVEWVESGVIAHTVGGQRLTAAHLLVAAGVRPRLDDVGLQSVGLTPDASISDDGRVGGTVWLFAAGDVTPQSNWTHGANHQAARLVSLFRQAAPAERPAVMPSCTFTNPPLGRVGKTAAQARRDGIDVVVGTADLSRTARFTTDELPEGRAIVVVDRTTRTIIGGSVFGPRADDLIQILTVLVHTRTTVENAASIVFPFPTIGQIIEIALDDARGRLCASTKGAA